ncbi:MAG: hypothetical protein QOI77_157, partial [Blastocatellia bacterium]|nr:hypothetical protein [Blastocatellia bacterium]
CDIRVYLWLIMVDTKSTLPFARGDTDLVFAAGPSD